MVQFVTSDCYVSKRNDFHRTPTCCAAGTMYDAIVVAFLFRWFYNVEYGTFTVHHCITLRTML
jgi:hypothetical protein